MQLRGMLRLVVALWMTVPALSSAQKRQAQRSVTEVFHVARVGQGGAAESREVLLELYGGISEEYNQKLRDEQSRKPQMFKGERVRVLKKLNGRKGPKNLYLVAYDGGPSVFEMQDNGRLTPGELSPPLIIVEDGEHTTRVTRKIKAKMEKEREPALEVIDEKKGEVPTFFGIPVDTGESGNRTSSNSEPTIRTLTETKTLPKFRGSISKEREEGELPLMTTEIFLKQLKNGEIFSATRNEERRCQQCRGFGRVKTNKPIGLRDPDGKMACPDCQAAGKLGWIVTYKVAW